MCGNFTCVLCLSLTHIHTHTMSCTLIPPYGQQHYSPNTHIYKTMHFLCGCQQFCPTRERIIQLPHRYEFDTFSFGKCFIHTAWEEKNLYKHSHAHAHTHKHLYARTIKNLKLSQKNRLNYTESFLTKAATEVLSLYNRTDTTPWDTQHPQPPALFPIIWS